MDDFGYKGAEDVYSGNSEFNAMTFIISQMLARVSVAAVVKVVAVADGTVDVVPLVNQLDGSLKAVAHGVIYGLPAWQLQGGANGVVIAPQVNDIGVAIFSDRDISVVKTTRKAANPGSLRRFDMADGIYFGGILNTAPQRYLQVSDNGVVIKGGPAINGDADAISLTAVNTAQMNGATASVHATNTATVSGATVNVSGTTGATVSGGSSVTTSGNLNTVAGSFVMLGAGPVGNLSQLPGAGGALFLAYQSSGAAAICSNPVAGNISTLSATLSGTTINDGLTALVTAGTITPTDQTNIMTALTGTGGLKDAATALATHTDLLSGVAPVSSNVPHLAGIIGVSNGLDTAAGGAYGSASNLLNGMTTSLTAGPTVAAANTYATGIVSALTAGTATPASVISTIASKTSALTGFVNTDKAAYSAAQNNVKQASGFLGLVANAKSANPAVQTMLSKVISPSTLSTLQGIGP